jgi:DNA-binding GntR family transcriptional regulator
MSPVADDSLERGAAGKGQAVRALRQAIRNGDMAPGQRLVEAELAETFRVTRASVRAALLDLTAEGLVERIPNRGARVRSVSLTEAVQITECRMMLEGLCAAKAAEHATDEQIAHLVDIGERLRACVQAGEPLKYSELNQELHRHIQQASGQDIAMGLLGRLNAQLVRHQFRLALQPGRPQVSLLQHLAIVEAIRDRDLSPPVPEPLPVEATRGRPRRYLTTIGYSPAGTSSPITGAPGISPATSRPPDVWASASSSASSPPIADRSACGRTQSRLRRVPPLT